MRGSGRLVCLVMLLLTSAAGVSLAEEPTAVSERAAQYHQILRTQPEPGYLFDRFYNEWLDHGTLDELSAFLEARVEQPGETADQLLLAFFYLKQGERVRTLRTLEAALAEEPEHAAARYHLARLRMQTLDFDGAIEEIEKAAEVEADAELALQIGKLRGQLYARTNQQDKARQVWAELLEAHPDDEYLYEDLIDLQVEEALFDEALATAAALIEQTDDPYQRVVRRLRMGDIHQRAGRRDEALEVYAGTLDDVGGGSWLEQEIYAQIAQVFRREDDLTGLRDYYEQLLDEHDQRVLLRVEYADLLNELGNSDEAIEQWREILALTPGETEYRESYVDVLAEAGRRDEAIEALQALIEDGGGDGELLVRLAELHDENDATDEAAATLRRYLEESDQSLFAYLRTTRLMERFELRDEALAVYEQMREAHEGDAAAARAHAEFLYRIEREDEALAIWREQGAEADLTDLLDVSRALSGRSEHEAAFEILHNRFDAFEDEPTYLAELCQQALRTERYAEALPWARRRMELVNDDRQFDAALADAVQMVDRSEQVDALVVELQEAGELNVADVCLLAELLERRGQRQEAEAALADAEAVADDQPETRQRLLRQRARLHEHRRDFAAAADIFEGIIELPGGRNAANLRHVVDLYARARQPADALQWIDAWREVSPSSVTPWVREAELHASSGDGDAAVDTLRKAIQRFDSNLDLRARLAQLYRDKGDLADAQRIYERLYEEAEQVNQKLNWVAEIAELAEQRGRTQQLVENFERRRQTNRGSSLPYLALAEIHRVNNNYEERRQALMEATRIEPNNHNLLLSIASIEEREGDYERAIETLERAAELDRSGRAEQRMARLHLRVGDEEQAYRLLYELAGGEQIDARSIEQIADAMAGNVDWERTAEFLRDHRPRFPDDYRLAYLHAVALEEIGAEEAARQAFLEVLATDAELPNARQQANPMLGPYESEFREFLPEGAMQLIRLQSAGYQAYMHRQRGMRMTMMGGGGQQGPAVMMPTDLQTAHDWAVYHLMALAQMLDEPDREQLATAMHAEGVVAVDLLLSVPVAPGRSVSLTPTLLEEHDDDPALAGLWVMETLGGGIMAGEQADQAVRYFEQFRESHPQLAVLAGLVGAGAADQEEDWVEQEVLPLLAQVDEPNVLLVFGIAERTAGGIMGMGQPRASALSAEVVAELNDRLIDWYPDVRDAQGQLGVMMFMMISQATAQQEDLSAYVRLLEDEIDYWQDAGNASNPMAQMFGMMGGQGGSLLEPLTFPPSNLPDVPSHVAALLTEDMRNMFVGESPAIDPEALAEAIDNVQNDMLKALLAHQAGQDEVVGQTLERLLDVEAPTVSAYLLAAAWAADHQEDPARAIELLNRARFLPMTADLRRRIDAAIVAWAIDMDPEEESELVEFGRQAALRLRQAQLGSGERQQLMVALEDLGLTEEAAKLEQAMQATPGNINRLSSGVNIRNQTDRLSELVRDGRTESAVNLAYRQAQQMAQARMSATSMHISSYEIDELRRQLERHRLTDDVLAKAKPDENASPRRRMVYASICELLGETEQALEVYEQVAADRPNDAQLRTRLALLTSAHDPEAAAEHLTHIPRQHLPMVGQQIQEQINNGSGGIFNDEDEFDATMGGFEMIHHWLAMREPDERADISWAGSLLDRLYRMGDLPIVYDTTTEVEGTQAEAAERRDNLYRELSERLMEEPSAASAGFKHRLALAEHEGEDLEPFVEQAQRIVTQPQVQSAPMMISYSYSSNANAPEFREPQEFLVYHAWRGGDRSLLDETIIPAIREAGKLPQAEATEGLADLYFVEESGFVEAAEAFVESGGAVGMRLPGMDDGSTMNMVVKVWRERELEVDLVPLVADRLEKAVESGGYFGMPNYVPRLARILEQRKGAREVRRFVAAIAEAMLGPEEDRAELVAQHYVANSVRSGTFNARIHAFAELAQGHGAQNMVLMLAGLEQICRMEADLDYFNNFRFYLQQYVRPGEPVSEDQLARLGITPDEDGEAPYSRLIAMLAGSALLDDADQFIPYQYGSGVDDSVLGNVYRALREDRDARQAVRDWLAAIEEPTFGEGLLRAMLEEQGGAQAYNYLGEQAEAVAAMPERSRAALARAAVVWGNPDKAELSDAGRTMQQRLRELRSSGQSEELEKLLAARTLEDIGVEGYNLPDYLQPLLSSYVEEDVDQAHAVLGKVVELARDAQRRNTYNVGYGSGTIEGHLVSQAVDSEHIGTIVLAMEFIRDELENPIEVQSYPLGNRLNQPLFHRRPQGDSDPLQQLTEVLAEAAQYSRGGNLSYLAPALWSTSDERLIEAVASWADHEPSDDPAVMLQREAGMVALLKLADDKDATDEQKAAAERAVEHYVNVLRDESLSLTYRIHVAELLLGREGFQAPELLREAGLLLAAGLEADGVSVRPDQINRLLSVMGSDDLERDGDWHETAKQVVRAYVEHRRGGRPSATHGRVNSRPAMGPDLRMLRLALEIDDSDAVGQLVTGQSGAHVSAWVLLARHGAYDRIPPLIRRHAERFESEYSWGALYDADLAAAAEKLPAAIESSAERYVAELVVAAAPDEDDYEGAPRDHRLADLADRFDELPEASPFRSLALTLLVSSDAAAAKVADDLAEHVAQWDAYALFTAESPPPDIEVRQQLMIANFTQQALAGDYVALETLLGELSQISDSRLRRDVSSVYGVLGEVLDPVVIERLDELTPDDLAAMLPLTRLLLAPPEWVGGHELRDRADIHMLALLAAGEDEELAEWQAPLTEYRRFRPTWRQLRDQLAELLLKPEETPVAERVEFLVKVLADESVQSRMRRDQEHFKGLVEAGLLDEAAVIEHGERLAEAASLGGQMWAELARYYEQDGRDADPLWRRATERTDDIVDLEAVVSIMREAGRAGDARLLVENHEPADASASQRLDRLRETFEDTEAQATTQEADQ